MVKAQAGDKVAYRQLLTAVMPLLQAYVRRRLFDKGSVDDLCQDILLKVHAYRHSFDSRHKFEAWLFTIAANTLTDHLRSRGLRSRWVALEEDIDQTAVNEPVAETALLFKEAVAGLTAEQVRSLEMVKVEGRSIDEVARATKATNATVKVRAHRATKAFLAAFKRSED